MMIRRLINRLMAHFEYSWPLIDLPVVTKLAVSDLDVEMDEITAQLKENMRNIDTLQRGKCGNK